MTQLGIRDPLVDLDQQRACRRLSQTIFEVHEPVSLFESVESNTSPRHEAIPSSKFVVFDFESVSIAGKGIVSSSAQILLKGLGRKQSKAMQSGAKVGILESSKIIHRNTGRY